MTRTFHFFYGIRKWFLIGALTFICSGCCTMINPDCYNITVQSSAPGADCTVYRAGQMIFTGKTPCTVPLSASFYDCIFTVNGQSREVRSTFSPWFLGNIIWYYGAPVGMLIDIISGRMWVYPTDSLFFN